LLYLGPFATMADPFAVAPLLIPIAVSLHVSLAAASGAASLYYLAYGLFPPLYGVLADRFGRVRFATAIPVSPEPGGIT
jgi:MFS family permease